MIDMCNDGNVAYVFAFGIHKIEILSLITSILMCFLHSTVFQFTTFFADYKEILKNFFILKFWF